MEAQTFTQRVLIVSGIAVAIGLTLLLISQTFSIILLAFACWVLATAINMVVERLIQWGVKRGLAIGLTIAGVILLVVLFGLLVVPSLIRQIIDVVIELPTAAEQALQNYADFRANNQMMQQLLPDVNPDNLTQVLEQLVQQENGSAPSAPIDILGLLGSATSTLVAAGSAAGNAFLQIVLVLLITVFLVVDPLFFERSIVAIVPKQAEPRTIEVFNAMRQTVRQWVGAMILSVTITSVLYWVVLGLILGLPSAIALSLIAGIATIVPTIGPTIAIIPVVIFALAEGPIILLTAVVLYAMVGIVQDRVITPAIMKSELNIPATGLVLFQLVAGSLLGFIGVVIAVPLLAVLITLADEVLIRGILEKEDGGPQLAEVAGEIEITDR